MFLAGNQRFEDPDRDLGLSRGVGEASSQSAEARVAEAAGAPSEQLLAKQLEISRLKLQAHTTAAGNRAVPITSYLKCAGFLVLGVLGSGFPNLRGFVCKTYSFH